MFKLSKILISACGLVFLLLVAAPAGAQTSLLPSADECTDANPTSLACCVKTGNCTLQNGIEFFARVGQFMLGIVGSLVLAIFVFGGFLWLTSGGNTERVTKGRKMMLGSVIGLVIVFGAYIIVINIKNILVTEAEGEYECETLYGDTHSCIDINSYQGNPDACLVGLCPGGIDVQCCPDYTAPAEE